ncbi:MAG: SPFH domain-containing protein [Candidatus Odinarchaeota archaeon]
MALFKHFKGEPSRFIIKHVSGKIKKKGTGISFLYQAYNTTVISIPILTVDSNFIFNEVTKNYQSITLQGHFTYKIRDPLKMASLLNFQIDPKTGQYTSEDPEKLQLRIKNVVQMQTRNEIAKMDLEEALAVSTMLADAVLENAKDSSVMNDMGIEILSVTFNSVRPTAELAKALEADFRESLQRKADEAIYARRAAAVEQERKIRENELNTRIALEEKKKELITLSGENITQEAEYGARAKSMEMGVYQNLDPRLLLALSMKSLSENAAKIGSLTITSEILASLLMTKQLPQ